MYRICYNKSCISIGNVIRGTKVPIPEEKSSKKKKTSAMHKKENAQGRVGNNCLKPMWVERLLLHEIDAFKS